MKALVANTNTSARLSSILVSLKHKSIEVYPLAGIHAVHKLNAQPPERCPERFVPSLAIEHNPKLRIPCWPSKVRT